MKHLLAFFLLSLSFSTVSMAQSSLKNWARVQAGPGVCGTGDRTGYVVNLSGGRHFFPRFKAGVGFTYAGFDNGVYRPAADNKALALSFEANAYFNVIQARYFKVELGAGPHVQLWSWQYKAEPNSTIFISGSDVTILPNQKVEFDETQFGYNASLGLVFTPTESLEIGLWAVHQNGFNGDNISSARAGVGFRF